MTSIDPVRLASIISSLSLKGGSTGPARGKKEDRKSLDSDFTSEAVNHEALKGRLTSALRHAKKQGHESFAETGPKILVQEIILWEFGEDFINHPEYRQISEFVSKSITTHDNLNESLLIFLAELEKQG